MQKTVYQKPELRDANNNIIQQGAFGKNTALSNSTNDGWIDYVMNDLEALHDVVGETSPTLDANGHVVEPANLAIGDEDGLRLKTGYLRKSGGTMTGTLTIKQHIRMQDNQENTFGGLFVPGTTASMQFVQLYGGETPTTVGSARLVLRSDANDHSFSLFGGSTDGSTDYSLSSTGTGELTWRGIPLAPLSSPSFTGNPTVPTQATNNNSTRIANTAFVTNDLKANTMLLADGLATTIPSGADLNDYKTAGTYISSSSSTTNSLSNCPVSNVGFKLMVCYNGYNSIVYNGTQILISSVQMIYVRSFNGSATGGSWGAWKHIAYAEDVLPLSGGTLTDSLFVKGSYKTLSVTNTAWERSVNPSNATESLILCFKDNANKYCSVLSQIVLQSGTTSLRLNLYPWTTTDNIGFNVALENTYENIKNFRPSLDNQLNLGISSLRWKQLYAGTTTISTSDERLKDNIEAVPDEVLDAWGEVNWYQYQFKDSIEEKGETKARIHTGAIAQRIESVFESHNLDANRYGLLCYDKWDATPAEKDEDGNIINPAQPAGNRYSLRYEEALCMEAAYQRRRADRLEERIARLEALLTNTETEVE